MDMVDVKIVDIGVDEVALTSKTSVDEIESSHTFLPLAHG
jgi:hypothetical protein